MDGINQVPEVCDAVCGAKNERYYMCHVWKDSRTFVRERSYTSLVRFNLFVSACQMGSLWPTVPVRKWGTGCENENRIREWKASGALDPKYICSRMLLKTDWCQNCRRLASQDTHGCPVDVCLKS